MNDDDFKDAFRSLEPIEPSAAFLRSAREIPARFPREEAGPWWRWLFAPQRVAALTVATVIGLSVGYATVEDDRAAADSALADAAPMGTLTGTELTGTEFADNELDELIDLAPGDDASQLLDQLYDLETEEL